jgi:hypothetical protein
LHKRQSYKGKREEEEVADYKMRGRVSSVGGKKKRLQNIK